MTSKECPSGRATETVKRLDIFGKVTDTYRTEAEHNGYHEEQGRLLDAPPPPPEPDPRQGKLI